MTSNVAVFDDGKTHSRAPKKEKERFSISLSQASARAFSELKEMTDADTDSEVFRTALRLHKMLLRAHLDGQDFLLKDKETGKAITVNLFSDVS